MKQSPLDYSRLLGFTGRKPGEPIDFAGDELAGRVGAKVAPPLPVCFLLGTLIRTPDGDRPVEQLGIGDMVTTLAGAARPIRWIGRQRFRRQPARPWVHGVRPVRIARGALGAGVPERDLHLSQAHAILHGGSLIPAGSLVGLRGITLDEARDLDVLDYFHVELGSHDVILAEGAPAETFLSRDGNREAFDNFAEFDRLYADRQDEEAAATTSLVTAWS